MGWTDLLLRLRALALRRRVESELDEELSFHLEMETRKARLAGAPEEEARRRARVAFGGVAQIRERCRDARGLGFLESLARDFRYAFRVLRRSPAFTAAAVLSLAIGIGGVTAVFSLADAVLLRMLPVRNPEQLVIAKWAAKDASNLTFNWATNEGGPDGARANVFSWQAFNDFRKRSRYLTDVFGFSPLGRINATVNGEARIAGALLVSGNYFSGLGVEGLMGRSIMADDDNVEGLPAAVISYRFWERALRLDPSVLGKTLYVNRHPCVVVGVTPREFFGVSPGGLTFLRDIDITLPILSGDALEPRPEERGQRFEPDQFSIQVMGRLRDPAAVPAARAELAGMLTADLPPAPKSETPAARVYLEAGSRGLGSAREALQDPLLVLFAIAGLTLLMACANLAGLLLARSAARRKEISLRLSLGAARRRIVRQLLCEGALISAAGAAAGMLLAWWGVRALLAMAASGPNPITLEVNPDARILGFTAAVSVLATLLFGLAPALKATRVDLAQGMKEDATAFRGPGRFGGVRVLLVVQIAAALLLASGATLLTRSLMRLRSSPLGFDPRNVALFGVSPGSGGYDEARGNEFYARLTERLRAIPGVTDVTLSTSSPISGWTSNSPFAVDDGGARKRRQASINFVGPGFLRTMRIPVLLGRDIETRDLTGGRRVALINEAAARAYFGNGSPLGRRLLSTHEGQVEYEIVGVAKDAKYDKVRGDFPVTVYIPYTQNPFGWRGDMQFEVRAARRPSSALPAIRAAVRELDPMLPVIEPKTLEAQINESLFRERVFAFLVSLFGAVTLGLACLGLYGLVSYSVAARTREIGVRVALGASRFDVLRGVLLQVCAILALGLAVGVPATIALRKVIRSMLFGIEPGDPASLAFACLAVAAVALLAAWVPARRAARIEPVRALRYE